MRDESADDGSWDFPAPHVVSVTVASADIDAYEHVNNAVYVTWCDRAAWNSTGAWPYCAA